MLQGSLFGRAEAKKTINVEANLLAERNARRLRAVRQVQQRLILIGITAALSIGLLPTLYGWRTSGVASATAAQLKVSALSKVLSGIKAEHEASVPKVADEEIIALTRKQSEALMGQIFLLLNSAPKGVAVSSIKADVIGGTATISCNADAEGFDPMREFLGKAGEGPRVESTVLLSSRRSESLASSGVSFDFVKKVGVGP